MRLTDFRLLTPLLLPFGHLPATHELQALGVLAVPLIPTAGTVPPVTPAAQADPQTQTPAAGRKSLAETMLEMSQREGCSRRGRPRDLRNLSGTFFRMPSPSKGRDDDGLHSNCRPF